MSNKIGDYIHFYAKNYIKNGNEKKSSGTGDSPATKNDFIRWKDKIMEDLQLNQESKKLDIIAKEIEQKFRGLLGDPNIKLSSKEQEQNEKLLEEIFTSMDEWFTSSGRQVTLDKARLTKTNSKAIDSAYITKNLNISNNKYYIETRRIEQAAKEFDYVRSVIIEKGTLKGTKKEEFDKAYDNFMSLLNTLKYDSKQIIKDYNDLSKAPIKTSLIGNDTSNRAIIEQMNEELRRAKSLLGLYDKTIIGDILEYLCAAGGIAIRDKSLKEAKEEIEKNILGGQRSNVVYQASNFADWIQNSELEKLVASNNGKRTYKAANGTAYSIIKSQDKVDAIINFKEQNYGISAKNYNLKSYNFNGIHVVSGTSLLNLLQDEDGDKINHWINTTIGHPNTDAEEDKYIRRLTSAKINADNMIKAIIIKKAIRGGTLKGNAENGTVYNTEEPDFFILNDNSQSNGQGFRVVSTASLVNKIISSLTTNEVGMQFDGFPITSGWWGKISDRKRLLYESPEARINDILRQLHLNKISASITPSMVNTAIMSNTLS